MDFSDLFTLSNQDYAVQLLARIFGDIVPYVTGDSTADPANGTWLTDLVAIFNQAMLLIALVVGSYTTYVMIFDTAADGQVFGNTSDTKYTILRVLIGGVAFVPISGGFTFAQMILIWLTVQGSALGDVAWRAVADNSLSSEQVLASQAPLSTNDFMVRGQFASAMYALTAGELCRLELNEIAENAGRANTTPINREFHSDTRTIMDVNVGFFTSSGVEMTMAERQLYFASDDDSYGRADNLCGSVSWDETYNTAGASGSASFATQVGAALINARLSALDDAMLNDIRPAAIALALSVHNGTRNDQTFKADFVDAVNAAFATFMGGAGTINDSQFQALNTNLIAEMDQLGWAMALSWHRGITMASIQAQASAHDLELRASTVQNAAQYFQGMGAWVTGRSSGIDRASFAQLENNFAYLGQFSAFVVELGLPVQTAVTTAMNGGDANAEGIIDTVYRTVLGWFSAGGPQAAYIDPMADLGGLGKILMGTGGVMVAASEAPLGTLGASAGATLGSQAPVVGTIGGGVIGYTLGGVLSSILGALGWVILGAGFFLLSILPAIPLIYFFSAVISWLALVIESMFAIPLAVLAYFAPARESSLIGPWNKMMLNLFGVLLRPVFTIIGFIASLILMRVGIDFLYVLFTGFLSFLASGTGLWAAVISVGLIITYVVAAFILILHCSSLITELGDAAMNWIGIGMSQLGKMDVGQQAQGALVGTGAIGAIRGGGRSLYGGLTQTKKGAGGAARQLRGNVGQKAAALPKPD